MTYRTFIFCLTTAILLAACQNTGKDGKPKPELDIPTRGHIKLLVDEGYKPIISSSIDVFDSIYKHATLDAKYVPEGEAVKALIDDSIEVIIISRNLSADEHDYFLKSKGAPVKITPVAYDAVALILHPSNHDTVFTVQQVREILAGKTKTWKEIDPKSPLKNIAVVFDHEKSGTVRYVRDSILQGETLTNTASAMKTNEEVIEYVSKNPAAIGIIAASWVSDTDDKGVQNFLKKIQLADVAEKAGDEGFGPYQAYLATGQYPFKRTIYVINAQYRAGLGLGFAAFLASDPGQRIVLKSGMLPATAPIRLIKTKKQF